MLLFIVYLLIISFVSCETILDDTTKLNGIEIGVTWPGGACTDMVGNMKPCPLFNFEAYNNGQPTGKYIEFTYFSVGEVKPDKITVETITVDKSKYGGTGVVSVEKNINKLPSDYYAVERDVEGGKEVFMNATLSFIQDEIDALIELYGLESYRAAIEQDLSDALGSDVWKKTVFEVEHFLSNLGSIEVQYGENKTITVSPDTFKFNMIMKHWPFAKTDTNHLKIVLRFTGRGVGCKWWKKCASPSIETIENYIPPNSNEDYFRVSYVVKGGRFNMDFIDEALIIEGDVSTLKPVEVQVDDQIDNGYVDVILIFPQCLYNDCIIVYDPTFTYVAGSVLVRVTLLSLFVVMMMLF